MTIDEVIDEIIAEIKIEDRKVARFGKHHLPARGAWLRLPASATGVVTMPRFCTYSRFVVARPPLRQNAAA
jgi:hypothetical protein